MGLCVLNSTNCPACGRKLDGDKCQHCQQTVRSILPSRVKNKDFARGITKYDLHGNFIKSFRNAYDAYPEDNQLGSLKRKQLIKVCRKETRQLDDAQWRFSGDVQDVGEISRGTALVQCDLNGKIINCYNNIAAARSALGFSYTTIKKTCTKRRPPQGANFFLFYEYDFYNGAFEKAKEKLLRRDRFIVVTDSFGNQNKYETFEKAANALNVSATSIRNWCLKKITPTGKFANYCFELLGNPVYRKSSSTIPKEKCNDCAVFAENRKLITELELLQLKNNELKVENSRLTRESTKKSKPDFYAFRKPVYETRVPFNLPLEEAAAKYAKIFIGNAIYILLDENGKAYVGKTNRGDLMRLYEHCHEKEDPIYKAMNKGRKFTVYRIITSWEEYKNFDPDDTEAYYIAMFDSYDNGYNETRGNHLENAFRLEKETERIKP